MPEVPRGQPLEPGRWYIPPVSIPPDPRTGKAAYQARQGDIFRDVPSIWVDQRPLSVARNYTPEGGRTRFYRLMENDSPQQPFRWLQGEDMIVKGMRTWGVLLTMDCDLDTERPMLTFGLIRLWDGTQSDTTKDKVRRRTRYRAWFLEAQEADPEFPGGYIDFARLTTVHPRAVDLSTRYASMADDVRDTMRIDFIEFMNLEREPLHEDSESEP